MGLGRERVTREGDTFFGYLGANGPGVGEIVRPGVCVGAYGDIG